MADLGDGVVGTLPFASFRNYDLRKVLAGWPLGHGTSYLSRPWASLITAS